MVRSADGKWYRVLGGGATNQLLVVGGAVGGAGVQILLNPSTAEAPVRRDPARPEEAPDLTPMPVRQPEFRPEPE